MGQGLAPGVGADGDAVGDGSGLQVVEAGTRFKVQVRIFRVDDQQTTSFQHPHDASAEGVEQPGQIRLVGPAGAVEGGPVAAESVGAIQEQHVQVDVSCRAHGKLDTTIPIGPVNDLARALT